MAKLPLPRDCLRPRDATGDEINKRVRFHVHIDTGAPDYEGMHRIIGPDDPLVESRSWGHLQAHMERAITRAVRRYIAPYHVVHAGAVARDGRAMLLPALSGSGKSTLVAALALSGFDYYTDEVTILTEEGRLLPYPKTITLKLGGWDAITALFPQAEAAAYAPVHHGKLRHLAAPGLPPADMMDTGCGVDFFVFPRYASKEPTSLQPISRAAALARLAERSLNLTLLGKTGLDIVFRVLQDIQCYELTVSDLSEAVLLLDNLLDRSTSDIPDAHGSFKPTSKGSVVRIRDSEQTGIAQVLQPSR